MRYISAYMLCLLTGKTPKPADIENVLSSVGVECDKKAVTELFNSIKEQSIESLINAGISKLASVPAGGAAAPSSAAPAAAASAQATKAEEAKAEKESSSESEADMGFGLFD